MKLSKLKASYCKKLNTIKQTRKARRILYSDFSSDEGLLFREANDKTFYAGYPIP